ncbi:beta-ketoacyl-[acyl-carrier-protein] synthase family protein [Ktedonosporobacter rubrisoli]|uniref:Beta-ketoacyl-[acyl-carrier-protein] synthase family protein n=1 Tax=Ktedonosporobacter rubrisoli TaxID=2509675 RepID=A0A4P6JNL0_KTERU|nr:beta-ketoacyl-[acyl-carrier-protein] synthase family protein [Ktedonosporobacter rubrisoli]QBD76898.1 beta-ketoacyl-[acyl-carrier-protein] synthase family protein [Ktedonosporobacter rubrisoli]
MARVVITGIGVVAPGGIGKEVFWDTLVSGKSTSALACMDHIERFRSQMVAAVTDWMPDRYGLTKEVIERTSRHTQFALVSAAEAWAESGLELERLDLTRLGVSAGTAIGSTTRLEEEYCVVSKGAIDYDVHPALASPYLYHAMTPTSLSAELAAGYRAKGPVVTVSTGCTAGLDAIAHAFEWVRDGDADIVIAGAADAGICPVNMAAFDAIKATSPRNDEPGTASRPFDASRNGFVLGEGSAVLIVEELEHARSRGCPIYAELRGYGSALNAYHMTGLQRNGVDMSQAITMALSEAGVSPQEIQYINAHGSSTQQNDIHETNAFKQVWGQAASTIPISSIKSSIGHSLGAIGALEIAACALVIRHHKIPPTINYSFPDPECDLDYVPNTAREQPVEVLISTASGFGGFQSALVMSRLF